MNLNINCLIIIIVSMLLYSQSAWADLRLEVISALVNLRKDGIGSRLPEEMKNLDDTYATAELYFQKNDRENAERYYRLALQKAKIIESRLKNPASEDSPGIPPETSASPSPENESLNGETAVSSSPLLMDSDIPALQEQAGESDTDVASTELVGTMGEYTVVPKDTLRLVAAKLGVTRNHLAAMNGIDAQSPLKIGQKLKYNNRKIIPFRMKNGIVINIPDRTLYFFRQGKLETSLPVALGISKKKEQTIWRTPTGRFKILGKQKDPTWRVPPSIQEEMREEGKEVITEVLPGPNNPLGKYAIKTSIPGIMIHSTSKPSSIYSFSSHGCIRMFPDYMEDFFKEVKVNTLGEIIYRPVKVAVTENGRVMLEVHHDIYEKLKGLEPEVRRLLKKYQVEHRVDWAKVEQVIRKKEGIALDVSL